MAPKEVSLRIKIYEFIKAFFPLHLLIAHLKFNLLALLYWLILFLIITDQFGSAYGLPLLYYSPEYMGQVSTLSFVILGFSIGGFNMGFNTYSYMKLAPQFQFLTSISSPFLKFCINNSLIPFIFTAVFLFRLTTFQMEQEYASTGSIFMYNIGYLFGFLLFHLLSMLYFFPMNRRVRRNILNLDNENEIRSEKIVTTFIPNRDKWTNIKGNRSDRAYLYFGTRLKLYSSRSNKHYKKDLLNKIYERNKVNATIFETLALLTFLLLGVFRDFSYFELPSAVSITLLLTIILMLFSALLSWLQRWTYPILILVIVLMDFLSVKTPFFRYTNYLYGLDYAEENRIPYTLEKIENVCNSDLNHMQTKSNMLNILDNWKSKIKQEKPKLIIVNVSGGGSRSALWTFNCLQMLDSEFDQKFMNHIQMITGASGGMIGAAYYRQLNLMHQQKKINDLFSSVYRDKIASDLLNQLSFAATTNDIFFRYQSSEINGKNYTKDRGMAFEKQLNQNTDHVLDVPLSFYSQYEKAGQIPLMIFTPTVVNDGRRMLISSQPLTFLTQGKNGPSRITKSFENIDYLSYFSATNPIEVRFSSVLRSSATFPFVMPMVTLPTQPEIQLMDAGLRDNYGGKITMEYLNEMSAWIKENTSGVIILQIRDTKKMLDNESYKQISLLDKFTLPFGNMYSNFTRTQDFDQEELLKIGCQQFSFPIDLVSFNLRESSNDKISLSWHLTKQEKSKIQNALYSRGNKHSLVQLKRLLTD